MSESRFARCGGIPLHPTSLQGPGIGVMGETARLFVDWMAAAGLQLWQVLPLGPTGPGDSPYSSTSAFAGNPLLIDLMSLADAGLLSRDDVNAPMEDSSRVDYAAVGPWKMQLLRRAFERSEGDPVTSGSIASSVGQQEWIDDFALYMALKQANDGKPWSEWQAPLRKRETPALEEARRSLHREIAFHIWVQHLFFDQWQELKRYAADKGIRIVGDLPIFIAHDSADVWINQEQFRLDASGEPEVVAGVPPDYFSPTGQLWGNPTIVGTRWPRTAFAGGSVAGAPCWDL